MTAFELDIVFVADARFPGGTSTALVSEIEAAHRAGFSAGLLHVTGPVLRKSRAFHPAVRRAIDSGAVRLLDPTQPVRAAVAIVHHPMLFSEAWAQPIHIKADQAVFIAHHPAFDNKGVEQYDIWRQLDLLEANTGLQALVAPVGPNVRATLRQIHVKLVRDDWHNLIDTPKWRRRFRPFGRPIVIGRHARPDPLKWPDEPGDILDAYPAEPHYRVEILGAAPFLTSRLGAIPGNWRLHQFGSKDVRAFLHGLDAYVYFHSSQWIEAFGYGALEALASGLPTILPQSFEPLFGEGAIYAKPAEVRDILNALSDDARAQRLQHDKALAFVAERYSLDEFPRRLEQLFGLKPRRRLFARKPKAPAQPRRRVALFMTSNGVGLGHLTRCMAIAKRLPRFVQPVFFTLSRAARLTAEAGYLVEHAPFHRYLETTPELWNAALERELGLMLDFYSPSILIFDGNVPYSGLIGALRQHRGVRSLWVRRGFWRADEGGILKRASRFDAVVEPGDYAAARDNGPTSALRDQAILVDPVLMIDPTERLSRNAARQTLGLSGRLAIALQLGSGANFDFSEARTRILEHLLAIPDVDVVELLSPVSDDASELESMGSRHHPMRLYPAFRFSRAFDAAICAAGYNSFHENLAGGIPTLFVANRAEEMDRQDLRARDGAERGLALSWSGLNLPALDRELDRLLDPKRRTAMRQRMKRLPVPNGAAQIAALIEEIMLAGRPKT